MGKPAYKKQKIEEALQLLDEASMDARDEISEMIQDRYRNFENTIADIQPRMRRKLRDVSNQTAEAMDTGREKIKESMERGRDRAQESALQVDRAVKENPWSFIGGTLLTGIALGFLLGRKD